MKKEFKKLLCPKCGQQQWTEFNCDYTKKFKACWRCDCQRYNQGHMPAKDFAIRADFVIYYKKPLNNSYAVFS